MNGILLAVLLVAGIGLLIGLILSVASIVMAVPKDEKAEKLLEALPGANCGACGYSGCSGYANALSKGKAEVGLCAPGGIACAKELSAILGVESSSMEKKVAAVRCMGSCDNTKNKAQYQGVRSCSAAVRIGGGLTDCAYGCLGLGDCEAVCPYDAIHVCNGVAVVDNDRCKACSMCVKECPRGLITLVPYKNAAVIRCSNKDKGAAAMKVCAVACIGCKKCEKSCEAGAVKVDSFCARIDPGLCTGCGKCVENCPRHCISYMSPY